MLATCPRRRHGKSLQHFKAGLRVLERRRARPHAATCTPRTEQVDLSAVFTDTQPVRGHESMRRYFDDLWEIWEGIRLDPLEVFDVGGGRFVVDVRWWGKGKRSGAEVDQRFAYLYTLREHDEKIVRCQLFPPFRPRWTLRAALTPAAP